MDKLGQIELFIRRMKRERADTQLALPGVAFIGAGLALSKVGPLKSVPASRSRASYVSLVLGGLPALVSGFKLWRSAQRPFDILEIKGSRTDHKRDVLSEIPCKCVGV